MGWKCRERGDVAITTMGLLEVVARGVPTFSPRLTGRRLKSWGLSTSALGPTSPPHAQTQASTQKPGTLPPGAGGSKQMHCCRLHDATLMPEWQHLRWMQDPPPATAPRPCLTLGQHGTRDRGERDGCDRHERRGDGRRVAADGLDVGVGVGLLPKPARGMGGGGRHCRAQPRAPPLHGSAPSPRPPRTTARGSSCRPWPPKRRSPTCCCTCPCHWRSSC